MAPTSCSILLTFLLILVVPITSDVPVWPIWDPQDPKVVSIAKFAVTEHNKKANTMLQYVSIGNGYYSLYSQKHNYQVYLGFRAVDRNKSTSPLLYDASVLYRPLQKNNSMELDSFTPFEGYVHGGLWPVESPLDPRVVSVAKFAVKEYSKKTNTTLHFVTVIKGKEYMVASSLYHLLILAKQKSTTSPKKYEAAVWYRPWEIKDDGFKLESFKILSKSIWID
ncbi:PREDICTED: multicystatin-like [Erythranthe guttata]|uniref:multicystatin-like n=1 Tax=Erythranthe guttata TaxID=4155 RepID=UPI00064D8A70|nr:PREDICTED: multicystatin-like [Erythranthe guttata]|eukprot:XP_012838055.1 PREDICTED: multicystatin-like [Erythranthe guttata]